MKPFAALIALAVAAVTLQGCVAAIPVAAAGAIGRQKLQHRRSAEQPEAQYRQVPVAEFDPRTAGTGAAATVPAGMQYLYGSGEAAALNVQAYFGLANYILGVTSDRQVGHTLRSVVIAPGSTLDDPVFAPCGDKPLAIVFDIDETAVFNLGFEGDTATTGAAYDTKRWDDWERTGGNDVALVPGMDEVAKVARLEKVTLIFNSNRSAANAQATAAMLDRVGLGPVKHGDTLWLQGDAGSSSGAKDSRRWAIAQKYCVIAMAGDQLGDFSDLFNAPGLAFDARRTAVSRRHVQLLWGHGWFIMPNPVYGSGLKGSFGEVFPADTQWSPTPPTSAAAPAPAPEEK